MSFLMSKISDSSKFEKFHCIDLQRAGQVCSAEMGGDNFPSPLARCCLLRFYNYYKKMRADWYYSGLSTVHPDRGVT